MFFSNLFQKNSDSKSVKYWIELVFRQKAREAYATLSLFWSSKQGLWREILSLHYIKFFGNLLPSHYQNVCFCTLLFCLVLDTIYTLFWYSLVTSFDHSGASFFIWMTRGFYPCFKVSHVKGLMFFIYSRLIYTLPYIYCYS